MWRQKKDKSAFRYQIRIHSFEIYFVFLSRISQPTRNAKKKSEYGIPYCDRPAAPIHSLTSLSGSTNEHFLDEIALLKRGKITRDTPKHTYRRWSAESTDPSAALKDADEGPITIAELNSRGLMLNKNRIIYNIPYGTLRKVIKPHKSEVKSVTYSSKSGSSTSDISKCSSYAPKSPNLSSGRGLGEDSVTSSKEFYVGNPGENAKLKISTLKDGISYRLCIMDDICLLQKTSKNTMLLCWKSH